MHSCYMPWTIRFLVNKACPQYPSVCVQGYKITSWSDQEEKLVARSKGGTVPKVESTLAAEGAVMVTGAAQKTGAITVDREVVSGSNPLAAEALGKKFVEMLQEGKRVKGA